MKIFLTGGTGFIGSYILSAALEAGWHVRALRRSQQSKPPIHLPKEPEWCEGGLTSFDPSWLVGVDIVIHVAAAGVSPREATWEELLEANVRGSLRLLKLASDAGIKRFLAAGSSHEYGTSAAHYEAIPPDAPLEPESAYGASKAAAFQLLNAFAKENQLELFYGRIFRAYGEGQYENNFWPSLRQAAIKGEDFHMTSGNQITDFITVETVAYHFLNACTRSDIEKGRPLVVNIGSGRSLRLLDFAVSEWKRLQAKGRLMPGYLPDRPKQLSRCVPDLQGLHPTNITIKHFPGHT
jgi:UDP-glucose 4-epimerase